MKLIDEDIKSIIERVGVPINDLEGSKIFISGCSGFLGSWFIAVFQELNKSYFKKPCTVVGLDSFIATDKENHITKVVDKNIKLKTGNVASMETVKEIFDDAKGFDYVIHAAGVASPVFYRRFPMETIDGMVIGLRHLLDQTLTYPVKSFLFFSSSEMYGNPLVNQVPTPEYYNGNVSCIGPRSCYDESKRMGETICHSFHRIHNTPIKWVRPFNISGPGMRKEDDRVLPKFIFSALEGRPVTVHLPGIQTRTFCYITDGIVGFLKTILVGKNGEVYNIGRADEEINMLDLANKVNEVFDGKLKIETIEMPTEYPQDQAQRRCPDMTKAREELNFVAEINLETAISRTLEWSRDNI